MSSTLIIDLVIHLHQSSQQHGHHLLNHCLPLLLGHALKLLRNHTDLKIILIAYGLLIPDLLMRLLLDLQPAAHQDMLTKLLLWVTNPARQSRLTSHTLQSKPLTLIDCQAHAQSSHESCLLCRSYAISL